jgi:DNA-binding FrmR family transcriptional regulator
MYGHVHAITTMPDEGRPYSEVVHQVVAVRAALDGVVHVIVDDLAEDCVTRVERKEPLNDDLGELQAVGARSASFQNLKRCCETMATQVVVPLLVAEGSSNHRRDLNPTTPDVARSKVRAAEGRSSALAGRPLFP